VSAILPPYLRKSRYAWADGIHVNVRLEDEGNQKQCLRNRLGDDPKPKPRPADDSKPASAATGQRRPKPAKDAADTTDQTAST